MNKIYRNEKMFEDANAKRATSSRAIAPNDFPDDFQIELFCECANKACEERIPIAHDEYFTIKQSQEFIIRPKHYLPEFEDVVKEARDYWTVIKRPEKLNKEFVV